MLAATWFTSDIRPVTFEVLEDGVQRLLSARNIDEWDRWSLQFLREYRDSNYLDGKALERAIRCCDRAREVLPFLFDLYAWHFRKENDAVIQRFSRSVSDSELLIVHASCLPRTHLALASANSFPERGNELRNVIVVGLDTPSPTANYEFDDGRRVLCVPAPDNYEGLARKMAATYRFLGFGGFKGCVLKVDDDIRGTVSFDAQSTADLAQRHGYAGHAINTRVTGFRRSWHLGKCTSDDLNRSGYSMIEHASFAAGPAYLLGPRAIAALARSSIYYSDQFEVERSYEDIAIGKMLNSFGIYPYAFNMIFHGVVRSMDSPTANP